jgi:hypothetical protein
MPAIALTSRFDSIQFERDGARDPEGGAGARVTVPEPLCSADRQIPGS